MGELYNPYPKLPKNIRQIGERDSVMKLYMEDYVNTYLKRLYPSGGQDLRVGLLLGELRVEDGVPYVFVDGAMEMEGVTETGEKVEFTDSAWKQAYQRIERSFPKRTVLGWFLCGAPGCMLSPLNYWKQHSQYFSSRYQLMYLNGSYEGDEMFCMASEEGFYRLRGYCIYYERNQMMQDYMVSRKDARRVESGARDEVIRDFRQRMEDKRENARRQMSLANVLGTVCGVLSVVVLAGGVAMFNNYNKMKDMEAVIASVMPEGTAQGWSGLLSKGDDAGDELEVEEVVGGVYPTQEIVIETDGVPNGGEAVGADAGAGDPVQTQELPDGGSQAGQASADGETGQAAEPVQVPADAVSYIVQEGETLYGICLERYHSISMMSEICQWNQLADQNQIAIGQELWLPPVQE